MPTYDYRCEANQQVYEVKHSMSQTLSTWGELCRIGNMDLQGISPETLVARVLSTGGVVRSSVLKNPEAPPCMSGGACQGGSCGMF